MSKLLATTTLAEVNPEPRDRRAASAAKTAAVDRERAVIMPPASQEAVTRIVRLLARQAARQDLSSPGDGG